MSDPTLDTYGMRWTGMGWTIPAPPTTPTVHERIDARGRVVWCLSWAGWGIEQTLAPADTEVSCWWRAGDGIDLVSWSRGRGKA